MIHGHDGSTKYQIGPTISARPSLATKKDARDGHQDGDNNYDVAGRTRMATRDIGLASASRLTKRMSPFAAESRKLILPSLFNLRTCSCAKHQPQLPLRITQSSAHSLSFGKRLARQVTYDKTKRCHAKNALLTLHDSICPYAHSLWPWTMRTASVPQKILQLSADLHGHAPRIPSTSEARLSVSWIPHGTVCPYLSRPGHCPTCVLHEQHMTCQVFLLLSADQTTMSTRLTTMSSCLFTWDLPISGSTHGETVRFLNTLLVSLPRLDDQLPSGSFFPWFSTAQASPMEV